MNKKLNFFTKSKAALNLIVILLLLVITKSCDSSSLNKKSDHPNFIIFIADDISWDDFGCYGNNFVQTPNIDQLSSEGIMFRNMYLATSSCSPSRNSIMTGRYPHNTGAPELHTEPPLDMISLAQELKNSGYFTVSSGKFHMGDYNYVYDEIAAIKEACGKKVRLKVILETGELGNLDNVRLASDIAIAAGADFIKTSTGKIKPAATLPVTLVMLEAIKDHYYKTGEMIGMKPAGGISNAKLALHYLIMVKETLGVKWLDNHWFRFGASSLANDLLMQIMKQSTGAYQSANYFSKD